MRSPLFSRRWGFYYRTQVDSLKIIHYAYESPRRQAHAGEVHLICSRNVVKILRCQIRVLVQDITYASMSNDDSNSPRYGARVRALFDLEIIAKPTSKQQMKSSCVRAVCVCVCVDTSATQVCRNKDLFAGIFTYVAHYLYPTQITEQRMWNNRDLQRFDHHQSSKNK